MNTIVNFVVSIIILIVVCKNFDKLIEIGNAIIKLVYGAIC